MAVENTNTTKLEEAERASWLPMIIILLAQIQMAFNVNALPVSIGAIVDDLDVPATAIGTALVVYSLFVAGFVMLGSKLSKLFGARLVFQVTVLIHGAAMALMAASRSGSMMNNAQAIAGLAAAALVPTLVVLIASNYHGRQQEQSLGLLAGGAPMAGVAAFLIAGFLATVVSWRVSFGALFVLSVIVFFLSFKLNPVPRESGVKIDLVGAVMAALAVILISVAFNNLNNWGALFARPGAPVDLFGLSPALFIIAIGVVLGQGFFVWTHKRQERGKTPLLSLEVLDSKYERSAILALFIISSLGPAVNFLIPLYIQIVQGRTSLQTAVAVVPYTVAIFAAAVLIVRLYGKLSPRRIGMVGFILVAFGLAMLAFAIRNEWGTPLVIVALVILGLGEGALITLLFNVLVSSSPKSLAGDVGALRGTANNLGTAIGTATAATLSVGLLSFFILGSLAGNQLLPVGLQAQVNLDNINFVSNDQLLETLGTTSASQEQVAEAVQINVLARLRALKASFLILAAIALLAIIPSLGLPNYVPGEIPANQSDEETAPPLA
jgi:predicted MFS family arabinose efflux permease